MPLLRLRITGNDDDARAIRIYEDAGFRREGVLVDEFFSDGRYHDVVRMCLFQRDVLREDAGRREAGVGVEERTAPP